MNAHRTEQIIANKFAIIIQETILALAGPGTTPMLMIKQSVLLKLKAPSLNQSSSYWVKTCTH